MIRIFIALFAVLAISMQIKGQEVYYGAEASAVVSNANLVKMNNLTKAPEFIKFEKGKEIEKSALREFLNTTFRLPAGFSFEKINEITDAKGDKHIRYRLVYQGYKLHEGMFIAHLHNDKIYAINGFFPKNFSVVNSVSLSETKALSYALAYVNAKEYMWQVKSEEDFIKREKNDPEATWYPKGEVQLKYDAESGKYRYAMVFDIYARKPLSRADYYVDAANGNILFINNKIMHADSLGSANTKYSGVKAITTDFYNNGFRLRESGRGNGIETYDMNTGSNYGAAVDFTDSDNYWNNVNAQKDEVAGDAHWGMEMTYDYYYYKHNRNSIDGNGFKLKGYVHYKNNYANAFWNGQFMTFGDGNSSMQPLVALDIVGHEITHGLTSHTADLDYADEPGALNEAYSDIFGTAIEFYGKPSSANWLIGEDIGFALRSMSNPKSKGDPDTYHGQNYYLGSADNGGVHTNSSVLNHWFYLTAAGGQGVNDNNDTFNVSGVGVDTAANIAFRTLTVYLTNTSNYADCRFYSIQSAMDLYGPCSAPVAATTSAFYAVGVGPDYVPGVNADFSAAITSYCSAPASISFNNTSNNANVFHWSFGDGDTSNLPSPTHTYTSTGSYTVELIASGGSCGADTLIKSQYISVDTANPCFTFMPSSGIVTKTDCQGVLFDDGGTANYTNNTNSTIVIAPMGASSVKLTFTDFHFESGYDFLKIYDGPNIQSPLIGSYDGDQLPNGGIITSTTGALTLVESTDQAVTKAGFVANWECIMPTTPPIASFDVIDTFSCSGSVSFADKTTNGPTSWMWYFGDGDSSATQNPTHVYNNNGYYTVTLKVSNGNGSNSITKPAAVHVEKPLKPYASSKAVCNGGVMTLTATGSGGKLNWYDSPTSTTPIDTGNSFTTPNLSQSTTYYVEEEKEQAPLSAGKPDNGGGGGILNYEQSLIFDVYKDIILHSVKVYSNSSGTRIVKLKNSSGNLLASKTINVNSGANTVILDFSIPAGTNYKISSQNLYRNNNNVHYPYVLPGILSINKSSASTNPTKYYYWFYDWKVKKAPCKSERREVHAYVNKNMPVADFTFTNSDPFVSFTDASQNTGAALWSFGDGGGSSLNNPGHLYLQNGSYQVTLKVNNGCGIDSKTKTVVIGMATGLSQQNQGEKLRIFPNPADDKLNIDLGSFAKEGLLEIIDFTGKTLYSEKTESGARFIVIDINRYAAGFYLVRFNDGTKETTRKLVVE